MEELNEAEEVDAIKDLCSCLSFLCSPSGR